MCADRRLLREHHRVGAVPDRVGDVGGLGARGPVGGDHRLEHLGGGNNWHAGAVRAVDDLLLYGRQLAEAQLDPQVAARNHDRVCHLEDVAQLAYRLHFLELGDDRRVAFESGEVLLAHEHVVRPSDERQGHVIDTDLDRELQVADVLVGERGQRWGTAWHRHALALAEQAAAHDGAHGPPAGDRLDCELDPAVVKEHTIALSYRLDELDVADLDLVWVLAVRSGEHDLATSNQAHERRVEPTRPDLRALQVADDRDRLADSVGRRPHVGRGAPVRVVVAMREVEPGHVHARLDEVLQHGRRRARRPDGADDASAADQRAYRSTDRPSSFSASITWRSSSRALMTAPPIPRTRSRWKRSDVATVIGLPSPASEYASRSIAWSAECPLRVKTTCTPSTSCRLLLAADVRCASNTTVTSALRTCA